jgi:hypothetical protein
VPKDERWLWADQDFDVRMEGMLPESLKPERRDQIHLTIVTMSMNAHLSASNIKICMRKWHGLMTKGGIGPEGVQLLYA